MRTIGIDSGIRTPAPVVRAAYGTMDSIPHNDSDEFDDDEAEDGLDELPVQALSTPIHFAFGRGGKIMDWGTNEVCVPSKMTVLIDPSPFQLMEMTPMRRVDMLFRMLKLNNVFVARSGKLMGVISLERMMTFLGTTTPYQAPGLLRTLKNFCSKEHSVSSNSSPSFEKQQRAPIDVPTLASHPPSVAMNMNQMKNASNLHAANATSVVGNSMAIPSRLGAAAGAANGGAAAPMNVSAAQLGQMNLSHVRSAAFKPAVPVAGANVVLPSAGAAATVPNTAGAGALQLSGRWSLDREDSDSTNDYLEAMGLPLIARQAADKLDLMVIISQTPGDFVITRRTRIFTETKHLKFGQEVNVKNNLITVTGDASQVKTITQLSGFRGVLTDLRSLDPRGRMWSLP
ncbi:Chloride Channel (ClC) Family [Phytophthora palmivora]|uniref:Chloride Channel (ClC) Family n=1 Tax=Phytophthora palmivora TaxID=4796 RepID=A0A2P4X643_9STRA|nr:Chloride Channel (ClC) Family [Phytophthora palmivora]